VVDLGKAREIVGVVGVQRVSAGAALQRQQARSVTRLQLDLLRRQVAHDVEQQAAGNDDAARLVDVGQELSAHRQLHVGRRELDRRLRVLGIDQDTGEDLHARALRHAAGNHLEVFEEVVLGAGDAHSGRSLDG